MQVDLSQIDEAARQEPRSHGSAKAVVESLSKCFAADTIQQLHCRPEDRSAYGSRPTEKACQQAGNRALLPA